jgi:NADPH:quinone reductase-like Zn-dependent oxidoreductase
MKATVIATTSTEEKAARLRRLGASHVINYRETPEWGVAARLLTPDGCGADVVVETGGPGTMAQSMAATRLNGIIAIAGASGGYEQASPHVMEVLVRGINLRGIVVGGPQMYREFLEFIERTDWKPALDDIAFDLEDAQRAFERLQQMSHFSKIVINI